MNYIFEYNVNNFSQYLYITEIATIFYYLQ